MTEKKRQLTRAQAAIPRRTCAHCRANFQPRARHQKFCSKSCGYRAWADTHRPPGIRREPLWVQREGADDGEQASAA
jgi:hypothetical protein